MKKVVLSLVLLSLFYSVLFSLGYLRVILDLSNSSDCQPGSILGLI